MMISPASGHFALDSDTDSIFSVTPLDYAKLKRYDIFKYQVLTFWNCR